jgi:bifunctional UDP-N-acetylglucosamine pyrophosphorylase/glucosamine-1-phosphate N-acetyltransferase
MNSELPKVLHPLNGRPLVHYSLSVAQSVTQQRPIVVVGYCADQVIASLADRADHVHQAEQLGTGHAVQQVQAALAGTVDQVLVISGDMPLFTVSTLNQLIETQSNHAGPISMLTVIADNPRGFGRVVRTDDGYVTEIVEEAVASAEQLEIRELNVGAYCFDSNWLWNNLSEIPVSAKGEYYLTDAVGIAVSTGLTVQPIVMNDPDEAMGINTLAHLAEAEDILKRRSRELI